MKSIIMQLALTLAVLGPCSAFASGSAAREIGDTGLALGNSATQTRGQFTREDDAVFKRFHALLCDVDQLRDALGQLPPELVRRDNPVVTHSAHAELQVLFDEALHNNPTLKPLRSALAGLAAQTRQAGAAEDPMAMLEFMDWPATPPLFSGLGEAAVGVSVSQEFHSYGKRGLAQQIASYDERLQQYELADRELKLCWEIVQKYYDIADSQASVRAMDRDIQLMGIIVDYGNRRYGLGLTPQAKVLEAQLTLSLMEKSRMEMRTMLAQQKEDLLELLGHPPDFDLAALAFSFPFPQPEGLKLDQPALLAQTLDVLPEYQHAKLETEQRSFGTELARRQYFPDYKLSAGYTVMHGRQDTFTASIELPLLLHKSDKQDAGVQQAYAEQKTAEDREAVIPNRLQRELANLQSELDMHGDNVEHYRTTIVPQARLTVESMLEGYASGMMQLDEVVMALQKALDVEKEYEQQRQHYVHVLSDLQVLTAGVFDPAPHMAYKAEEPPAGQPIGDSVGGLFIPTPPDDSTGASGAAAAPGSLPDPGTGSAAVPSADFALGLGLPAPTDAAAPSDADDFHRPFVPKHKDTP